MMTRRGKGEGSIRLRPDGRWEARFSYEQGGRSIRKSYFGRTQAEARDKMRRAQRKVEENLPLPSEKLTVEAYLRDWIEGKKGTIRPETWRRYDDLVRLHLVPELGRQKLSKLEPPFLRTAYANIGTRVSGTTTKHAHGVLHVALRDAMRDGLISRNVAGLVTAPRRSTGEMRFLGPDDAQALLLAARGDPLEALYVLALTAGMRLGELQALRWKDVDIERLRLRVTATLTAVKDGKPILGEPKTQHSKRTVSLAPMATDVLERRKADQDAQRRHAGPAWDEYGLVFTNALGRPLDGSHVLSRSFHKLLEKAQLPRMRFHDLRHSAASLLIAEGVPVKVVSEMLGHSDVTTTLRIYAHVFEGAQEQATGVMERLFGG